MLDNTMILLNNQLRSLQTYLRTPVWQPSLALALLHLSVLSYSATFITYLLSTGFSLVLITAVRALSSVDSRGTDEIGRPTNDIHAHHD